MRGYQQSPRIASAVPKGFRLRCRFFGSWQRNLFLATLTARHFGEPRRLPSSLPAPEPERTPAAIEKLARLFPGAREHFEAASAKFWAAGARARCAWGLVATTEHLRAVMRPEGRGRNREGSDKSRVTSYCLCSSFVPIQLSGRVSTEGEELLRTRVRRAKDILYEKERFLLFRADRGLPMGIPPASPMFQAQLRHGNSLQHCFDMCCSFAQSMVMEELLGGDAPLWSYLDECTERQSRANPFVSTTSDLNIALKYASKGSGAYLSVITPRSDTFRCVGFAPELHVGSGKQDQEIGLSGIVLEDEILAQIPVERLDDDIRRVLQSADTFSRWLHKSGRKFKYRPANTFSESLVCPNCSSSLPVYFHRQLGFESKAIAKIDLETNHPYKPFSESLILGRGAAVKCSCGQALFCPEIDSQELVVIRQPVFFEEHMEVDIENTYGSNIDVLWLWFEQETSGIREVRRYCLRERSAERWYRYPNMPGMPQDELDSWLTQINRSIPPGAHKRVPLQRDPGGKSVGVFGASFADGYTWIPLKRLEEGSWGELNLNEI
jgi:hypothetical protein